MTLLVDNRAGSRDLMSYPPLSTIADLVHFQTLGYPGDVVFHGNGPNDAHTTIGIEVKTLHDLYGSTDTGRLTGTTGQLPKMIEYGFDVIYIIYYGTYRASTNSTSSPHIHYLNKRRTWSTMKLGRRHCYFNGLTSITTELQLLNIIVHRLNNITETALAIGTLHRWWQKPWDAHKLFHQFNTVSDIGGRAALLPNISTDVLQRAEVLSSLLKNFNRGGGVTGGMGYKKSIELAKRFNSVHDMIDRLATDVDYVSSISWKVKSKNTSTGKVGVRNMTIGPVIAGALQRAVLSGGSDEEQLIARYRSLSRRVKKL